MASRRQLTARADPELIAQVNKFCAESGISQQEYVARSARLHLSGDAGTLLSAREGDRCLILDASTSEALSRFANEGDFDPTLLSRRILRQHIRDDETKQCIVAPREVVEAFRGKCNVLSLDISAATREALLLFVESRDRDARAISTELTPETANKLSAFREARDDSNIDRLVDRAIESYIERVLEYDDGTRERYEAILTQRGRDTN